MWPERELSLAVDSIVHLKVIHIHLFEGCHATTHIDTVCGCRILAYSGTNDHHSLGLP